MRKLQLLLVLLALPLSAQEPKEQSPLKVGKAFLKSEPSGAEIFKTDISLGKTPCMTDLGVGLHILTARFDGYESKNFEVKIKDTSIHKPPVVTLAPILISVDVIYDKPGWMVYVDGEAYKEDGKPVEAPATIKVSKGEHKIELKKGNKVVVSKGPLKTIIDLNEEKANILSSNTNLFSDFDFDNYNTITWNKLKGTVVVVHSKQELRTNLHLKGRKLAIVPHPSDSWRAGPQAQHISDYKGLSRKHKGYPIMSLCYKLDGEVGQYGVVSGEGELILFANDFHFKDNSGTMRVKLVPVE